MYSGYLRSNFPFRTKFRCVLRALSLACMCMYTELYAQLTRDMSLESRTASAMHGEYDIVTHAQQRSSRKVT